MTPPPLRTFFKKTTKSEETVTPKITVRYETWTVHQDKSKSHMVLLMDIIDASCTIPWIFLSTPPTPHPRALRWHVQYMWSTCEVRTRAERRLHATTGDPLSEKPGLKVTQVQRHFSAKKKFNDSAPTSIDRAHTCWWTRTEQRWKCEAEKKSHSNFEDFWESHLITIFACQSPQYWKKYPFRIYFHVMSQPGFLEGCLRQVLS